MTGFVAAKADSVSRRNVRQTHLLVLLLIRLPVLLLPAILRLATLLQLLLSARTGRFRGDCACIRCVSAARSS